MQAKDHFDPVHYRGAIAWLKNFGEQSIKLRPKNQILNKTFDFLLR